MDNKIIEGLPSNGIKVFVAECEDPSTFWVNNLNLFAGASQKQKYSELERELADCQDLKLPCFESHLITVGELVAVNHPETNMWCRGKVCDIYQKQSKYFYKVFLVDKGYPIVCVRTNLRNLPHAFEKEPFETCLIKLNSIIPRDFEAICFTGVFSSYWTREAFNLVTKLITNGEAHYFVPQLSKHIICGELYVLLDNKFVNIGDELCKAGLACRNPTLFKSCLNLPETEQIQTEFDLNKSMGSNIQCGFSDMDNVEEMDIGIRNEMDVTKCNGFGRGKLKMFLENSGHEPKPGLERNLVKNNSDLKVSNTFKNPLIGLKHYFSDKQKCHKISIGRGEHLKILQNLSKEYRQESNPCVNKVSNLNNKPVIKADDDHENLIEQFNSKLSCNDRKPTVPFVPAGAESSVLQRIMLRSNR